LFFQTLCVAKQRKQGENLNKNYVFGLEKVFKFNKPTKCIKFRHYFTMRGGSLKKIAKKIIPNVPINKKV
jgi:hypothetical protein